MAPPKFTMVALKSTDHRSNIIMTKAFEVLQELPKCDTETPSEQLQANERSDLLILIYNTGGLTSGGQHRKFSMDCVLFLIYK